MAQTVLVIDDSASIRSIVRVYLMSRGFEFLEADSGARALLLARLSPVDLIIADVNMPRMDGIEFVRELRKNPSAKVKNVPVILLTANAEPDLEQRGRDAGANAFARKPVSSQQLLELVNSLLPRAERS